jgi:dephospho-CoA kinase
VVVIEAIKLLEGDLHSKCDSIWVTDSPESIQVERLMTRRGMSQADALQRVRIQAAQENKLASASVVIKNTGSFEETWKQVVAGWKTLTPQTETGQIQVKQANDGEFTVVRGRPRDSAAIAGLITRLSQGAKTVSQDDVMAAFGEKAFMLLHHSNKPVGIAGWQVENLVARTTDFFIEPDVAVEQALRALITEMEHASQDLQCEASLLFLPPALIGYDAAWKQLGYERRAPQSLGVQAWQDAAIESAQPNTTLFFKLLRQDRVLRPI